MGLSRDTWAQVGGGAVLTAVAIGVGLLVAGLSIAGYIALGLAFAGGVLGLVLLRATSEHPREHVQQLRDFAAHLRTEPWAISLDDNYDARDRLLRTSLRSHYPELARSEDQLHAYNAQRAEIQRAMQARAARETASLFPGVNPVGPQAILSTEAESLGRDGRPHYGDRLAVERSADGDLWFGAHGLGNWHLAERDGSLDAIRRDLSEILLGVHEWDEVRQLQALVYPRVEVEAYDELLARISISVSLPGVCDLCSRTRRRE